jgi:hypothetical protein
MVAEAWTNGGLGSRRILVVLTPCTLCGLATIDARYNAVNWRTEPQPTNTPSRSILESYNSSLDPDMINAVLVFNNNGQPRLTKFYTQLVRPLLYHGSLLTLARTPASSSA